MSMIGSLTDLAVALPARYLYRNNMEPAGIGNYKSVSKVYNRIRHGPLERAYRGLYRRGFEGLLRENGLERDPATLPLMRDGWVIDTSGRLPHLEELIREVEEVIGERGGKDRTGTRAAQQPYFFYLIEPGDLERYPSFLSFALSSELLYTVGSYLRTIPVLSRTMPPGVRLMESTSKFDRVRSAPGDGSAPLRASQMFHLDIHDSPLVYVIVLIRDVTIRSGPWSFLSASASARAAAALGYQSFGVSYRVPDERMYACVPRSELIEFTYPRGSVLFIDSSRCFHYGSRDAVVPRYQMMYGFTTPCRTDLTETFMRLPIYPRRETDSRLRRLVLRREPVA
jgi:hypothetical protein